ncbi:LysR family transcriptional regulator [Parafrankia discariae]|uniref:LysR family transcriptional regulator n=1 Tax=Parafrankia discariae TaxID=365528 RepID=UPI00036E5BD1|nr:LysR family transcriptional regulator [Parafrankia discariae]
MPQHERGRGPDPRITLARLRVFVSVAELDCSVTRAADELRQTSNAVRQNLDLLQSAFAGRSLFAQDRRGLSVFGAEVYRQAREMMDRWGALSDAGSSTLRITFLPQHAHLVSAVMRRLRATVADERPGRDADGRDLGQRDSGGRAGDWPDDHIECTTNVLGEQDRSMVVFEENVIGSLLHGATDLVIGPPPRRVGDPPALDRHRLYTSRLEAMIDSAEAGAGDGIELRDLVRRRLLVPPLPARSRQMLEREIAEHIADDPGIATRVAHEAYGTKVLVAFGQDGHGTVVVPSDIALPFKSGSAFAGTRAGSFRWVPVRRDGVDLTQDVYATTRVDPGERALRVVRELRTVVRETGLDAAAEPEPREHAGSPAPARRDTARPAVTGARGPSA